MLKKDLKQGKTWEVGVYPQPPHECRLELGVAHFTFLLTAHKSCYPRCIWVLNSLFWKELKLFSYDFSQDIRAFQVCSTCDLPVVQRGCSLIVFGIVNFFLQCWNIPHAKWKLKQPKDKKRLCVCSDVIIQVFLLSVPTPFLLKL